MAPHWLDHLRRPKKLLSLCIENTSLKLLASIGRKVLAWAIIPLNPAFLRGGFVVRSPQLTSVVRTALSRQEFAGRRRVLTCLPAFHSVGRVLQFPNLPGLRPEIVISQRARRDMGYSAESSLLFRQRLASEGSDQRFFVLCVPKEPVTTLAETLKAAGLHLDKMETNTFALCRAVNQSQAVIIAVEPKSLHSIIMRDGLPLATQSTFWGEEPRDPESLPAAVSDALQGIITFYNESNPANLLPADGPVYLFGSAVLVNPEIIAAVENVLGRPVAEFSPPLVCPPDFPKAELVTNIGLVLGELR